MRYLSYGSIGRRTHHIGTVQHVVTIVTDSLDGTTLRSFWLLNRRDLNS